MPPLPLHHKKLHPAELPLYLRMKRAPCGSIGEERTLYPHPDGHGTVDTHTHPCVRDQITSALGIPIPFAIERTGTTFSDTDIQETITSNDREMRVIAAPHYLFSLSRSRSQVWPRSLASEYRDHKQSIYQDALRTVQLPVYADNRPETIVHHQATTTRLYLAAAHQALIRLTTRHRLSYKGYRITGSSGTLEPLSRQALMNTGAGRPVKISW
jgi:hypothetical protein